MERKIGKMAEDRPKRGGLREDQVTFETTKGVEVVPTFDQMNFKEDLVRGIYAYGKWMWTRRDPL